MEGGLRQQIAVGDDTVNGPACGTEAGGPGGTGHPLGGAWENQFCGLNGRGQA